MCSNLYKESWTHQWLSGFFFWSKFLKRHSQNFISTLFCMYYESHEFGYLFFIFLTKKNPDNHWCVQISIKRAVHISVCLDFFWFKFFKTDSQNFMSNLFGMFYESHDFAYLFFINLTKKNPDNHWCVQISLKRVTHISGCLDFFLVKIIKKR